MNLPLNKFAQVKFAPLVCAVLLALTGCGQDKAQTQTDDKSAETKTQPSTDPKEGADSPTKPAKTIAISAIVEHPSLNDIRTGVVDGLASLGYKEGQNLTVNYQSAQGNMATVAQISKQFVADNPDAIVGITTPTAQSLAAASQTIPLVYTAVSDPVAAKLIDSNNKATQANITGLSSQLPLEPQVELFSKIKPEAKRIGFVYSPGEANSVAIKNELTKLLPTKGMTLVDVPANRSADVGEATKSLAGKVDLIYTSLDNGVASAMEAMVGAANEMGVPVIASDEFSVRRGASAALGVNDYDFGKKTAELVAQVLDGKAPSDIEPAVMNTLTLFISPKHAKAQGVSVDLTTLGESINVDEVPARSPN